LTGIYIQNCSANAIKTSGGADPGVREMALYRMYITGWGRETGLYFRPGPAPGYTQYNWISRNTVVLETDCIKETLIRIFVLQNC
jgi:hypothetical protein